jgi:hypothetical protein
LRDPRVIRANLNFGALALARAPGEAIEKLRELAEDRDSLWPWSEVADILCDHGVAWRRANAGHVSLDQMKVGGDPGLIG